MGISTQRSEARDGERDGSGGANFVLPFRYSRYLYHLKQRVDLSSVSRALAGVSMPDDAADALMHMSLFMRANVWFRPHMLLAFRPTYTIYTYTIILPFLT